MIMFSKGDGGLAHLLAKGAFLEGVCRFSGV